MFHNKHSLVIDKNFSDFTCLEKLQRFGLETGF